MYGKIKKRYSLMIINVLELINNEILLIIVSKIKSVHLMFLCYTYLNILEIMSNSILMHFITIKLFDSEVRQADSLYINSFLGF